MPKIGVNCKSFLTMVAVFEDNSTYRKLQLRFPYFAKHDDKFHFSACAIDILNVSTYLHFCSYKVCRNMFKYLYYFMNIMNLIVARLLPIHVCNRVTSIGE